MNKYEFHEDRQANMNFNNAIHEIEALLDKYNLPIRSASAAFFIALEKHYQPTAIDWQQALSPRPL